MPFKQVFKGISPRIATEILIIITLEMCQFPRIAVAGKMRRFWICRSAYLASWEHDFRFLSNSTQFDRADNLDLVFQNTKRNLIFFFSKNKKWKHKSYSVWFWNGTEKWNGNQFPRVQARRSIAPRSDPTAISTTPPLFFFVYFLLCFRDWGPILKSPDTSRQCDTEICKGSHHAGQHYAPRGVRLSLNGRW